MKFRELKAEEIDVRVGKANQYGVTLLLYKDARVDQRVLDETKEVGPMNWQREHRELKGVIYCGVSIWDKEKSMWITKWDAGAESNAEKQKGEASDSFKRACSNWGIGRALYTAPQIKLKPDVVSIKHDEKKNRYYTYDTFVVEKITYKDGAIDGLAIKNAKTHKRVFLQKPSEG